MRNKNSDAIKKTFNHDEYWSIASADYNICDGKHGFERCSEGSFPDGYQWLVQEALQEEWW